MTVNENIEKIYKLQPIKPLMVVELLYEDHLVF